MARHGADQRCAIDRRAFTATALALAAAPFAARAENRRRLIGFLAGVSSVSDERSGTTAAFKQGMMERGYVDGRDFEIVARYADGNLDRIRPLAEELVRLRPDIILAGTVAAAVETLRATAAIPIVCPNLADTNLLKDLGLVQSMNRPGGNVTGVMNNLEGLPGKRLQLLTEIMPTGTRAGFLDNLSNATSAPQRREAEAAGATLGLTLVVAEVRTPADLESAFRLLMRERVTMLLVPVDSMLFAERRRIATLAAATRIGTVSGFRESVDEGGLLSYGVSLRENFRRMAYFIDQIWKGTKPGDLAVEFPTKVELVISFKVAKTLGITVPETILLRADEVIE